MGYPEDPRLGGQEIQPAVDLEFSGAVPRRSCGGSGPFRCPASLSPGRSMAGGSRHRRYERRQILASTRELPFFDPERLPAFQFVNEDFELAVVEAASFRPGKSGPRGERRRRSRGKEYTFGANAFRLCTRRDLELSNEFGVPQMENRVHLLTGMVSTGPRRGPRTFTSNSFWRSVFSLGLGRKGGLNHRISRARFLMLSASHS